MHSIIKIAVVSVLVLFPIVGMVSISKAEGTSVFFDDGKIAVMAPIHCRYTNHFFNPFMEVKLCLTSPWDALSDNSRALVVYNGNT